MNSIVYTRIDLDIVREATIVKHHVCDHERGDTVWRQRLTCHDGFVIHILYSNITIIALQIWQVANVSKHIIVESIATFTYIRLKIG